MLLRKLNAVLALLTTALLMNHAISLGAWMLSRGSISFAINKLPWVMLWLMAAHAVISIALAVLGHKGAEKREVKEYAKLNASTVFQRMSGILLILFTALHVLGTVGVLTPPPAVHAILPPLFFAFTLAHVAVSTSKAFITLGIGNAKFIKVADVFVKVLCGVTLVIDVAGFYLFLV